MNPAAPALSARALRVTLGNRQVLDGVDFDASAGEITAIVGPNGSGKTTLLRALAGLVACDGSVRLSRDGAGDDEIPRLRAEERARRLAYLPQTSGLSAMLSVRQVVALGRYAAQSGWLFQGRAHDATVERALDRVGLSELADRAYPRLSGGQQRLVLLARALATGARVLLLDEPTASLDVKHSLLLFALLRELRADGYAIVLVLHDLDDVQRHAQHALLLELGRAQAAGDPRGAAFVAAAQHTYGVSLIEGDRLGFRLGPSSFLNGGGAAWE